VNILDYYVEVDVMYC